MSKQVLNLPTLLSAVSVRTVLVLHNCLAVWRVGIARGTTAYWGIAAGNISTVLEGIVVLYVNGGLEWKWWCPCFLSYLLTTLPAVWLLQISQYESLVNSQSQTLAGRNPSQAAAVSNTTLVPLGNTLSSVQQIGTETTAIQTTLTPFEASVNAVLSLKNDTWIILIQESLVYLLVFGRWVLPRSSYSREALADLLLDFLAMASDMMELYAVFDEERVRRNLHLTYVILAVWSVSFFQFIPVFAHKQKSHHLQSARTKFIRQACGEHFAQVVVTCLSIVLQDGPFLCLRLYIMTEYSLVTYSLVFFVLKNIVTLMLLVYRLGILCISLPCCYEEQTEFAEVADVDFSAPVVFQTGFETSRMHFHKPSTMSNSLNVCNFIVGDQVAYQIEDHQKLCTSKMKIQDFYGF